MEATIVEWASVMAKIITSWVQTNTEHIWLEINLMVPNWGSLECKVLN